MAREKKKKEDLYVVAFTEYYLLVGSFQHPIHTICGYVENEVGLGLSGFQVGRRAAAMTK